MKRKRVITPIIPLHVYMTWKSSQMPPLMKKNYMELCIQNPEFQFHFYDDEACRDFIIKNFPEEVIQAYDGLIPGAYKADLWRLCVLYVNGGIYLDIKLSCINGFKLIELTEKNHFVKDRILPLSIYNAVMACEKNHPFLLLSIQKIVDNVNKKYYGATPLWPTGPEMLGDLIIKNNLRLNIDLTHYSKGGYVIYNNIFVFSTDYSEYNKERTIEYNKLNTKRYDALWVEKKIYR
jgi:mannosyltransferase OCH1-like enzyme